MEHPKEGPADRHPGGGARVESADLVWRWEVIFPLRVWYGGWGRICLALGSGSRSFLVGPGTCFAPGGKLFRSREPASVLWRGECIWTRANIFGPVCANLFGPECEHI